MRHTISSFRHSLFTFCSHPVHLRRPRYLRMNVSGSIALALLLALTTPALASVQPFDIAQGGPAARQISFADVAAAVVQSNFQLRAAALNIAIAQAQLAQAQGGQMPQATLSGSYTRTQEPPPAFLLNPNIYAAGVAISYPLSTGGRVEAQIALAQANLRGAQASLTAQSSNWSTRPNKSTCRACWPVKAWRLPAGPWTRPAKASAWHGFGSVAARLRSLMSCRRRWPSRMPSRPWYRRRQGWPTPQLA